MFFKYYNYYTRQVMLFIAICIIYAITLSIILLLTIIIVHERIIYKYFITQSIHIANRHNLLNIRVRPPTRWTGPTFRRKTSAATRRAKAVVKRGFICGINGHYRVESYSSSDFADRNNGSNGNFGI